MDARDKFSVISQEGYEMILVDLRLMHKLTQEEVAKCSGIPYNTYRRYEYRKTFPKPEAIVALAHLYKLRPGDLFEMLIGVFDEH